MKILKIILITCILIIGATDIILYHSNLDFFSQLGTSGTSLNNDNQDLFVANLKSASKYEETWNESMNVGVISKINRNLRSPSSLNKSLPEITASLSKSRDANENVLIHLNECKNYATSDVERQYIDLLLQKANINKKIYGSYAKMFTEYEKFAKKKLSPRDLSRKMTQAKQDLIENNAIDTDIKAIDNKILDLLKNNPDFQKKLESMDLNPAFLGLTY